MAKSLGIILLAYGSPENLDEMGAFLADIRGEPVPQEAVTRFRERYEKAGGPSPLNAITRAQAKALETHLRSLGKDVATFVGMAHCPPRITAGVEEAARVGVEHLVGLPMAPHFSRLSTGKYQRLFLAACERGFKGKTSFIDYFYDEPDLATYFLREIRGQLKQLGNDTFVLFSAHSLPSRILADNDPYPEQFSSQAKELAGALHLIPGKWAIGYQSQGRGKEPWLGSSLEEIVEKEAKRGVKKILVSPIGFVSDHVELLYDLDIDLKQRAAAQGVELHRTASPNTAPLFIAALGKRLERHLQDH